MQPRPRYTLTTRRIIAVVIVVVVVCVVIFGSIGIARNIRNNICDTLRQNGGTTSAIITHAEYFKHNGGRYHSLAPAQSFAETELITLHLSYSVNGKSYNQEVNVSYGDRVYLNTIYQDIQRGDITIRYQQDNPTNVRPALEFAPGAPSELCQ